MDNKEGQIIDEEIKPQEGDAGAPEGTVDEPSAADIKAMYEDLGIKANPPSGKPKGRPKADDGGSKETAKQDDEGGSPKKDDKKTDDSKEQPKVTPPTDTDGVDGDEADKASQKSGTGEPRDGEKDGKVSETGEPDESGVQDAKSRDNKDAGEAGKEDADKGDEPDEPRDGVKRPGKSNPEVEKRFQKLTSEVKERDELIAELQQKLQDSTRQQAELKISQEDPEYTIQDFMKVRDEYGEVLDLDPEQAELAWRRWKDGYDQRATEREARANFEADQAEKAEAQTRQLMKDSADAYDTLSALMDEYPELVSTSGKYDEEFAKEAMPIIEEAVQYLEGTEPGNPDGKQPVIVGLKINPKTILKALKNIGNKKRSLPLNGVNDNVESGSSVGVPHSRSADPTVQAANQLYKELGINKRI